MANESYYMAALSQLGLVLGTQQRGRDFYSLYLEPAFVSTEFYNASLISLVNDTAAGQQALAPLLNVSGLQGLDLGPFGLGAPE